MWIKVGYFDDTISRYSSCIFAEVWINTNIQKIRSNLQNIREREEREESGGNRVSLQSVPKQNFSAATFLSAGSVEVQYRALYRTHNIVTKIPVRQRKCDKGEMVRMVCVCCLEELEAMCFWHSCHSPFWKMHQSNCRTRGTGFGHTKSWPSSKPQWRGWKGAAAYSGGFELRYCAT